MGEEVSIYGPFLWMGVGYRDLDVHDLRCNVVFCTEIEHLLCFLNAADHGSGERTTVADEGHDVQ